MGVVSRFVIVLLVAAGVVVGSPAVSGACACGAFVANDKLKASKETALVEVDGRTEAVTLTVQAATAADQAAFLMPVPARARFDLADGAVFADLDRVSRPEVRTRRVEIDGEGTGGAAPGGSGATVVDHVEVGPFEVAQLSGTDATAVADWLTANHFTLPAPLAGALTPYLAEGWLVVAVRLTGDLKSGVPPMRIAFETDAPVYPMRLSATAESVQPLRLYVLSDHRVAISNPAPAGSPPELTFAGPVSADPAYPALTAALKGPRYLTRFDASFSPHAITEDIRITRAATDDPYRAVVTVTEYVRSPWPSPWVFVGVGLGVVGVVVALVWWRRRVTVGD